MIIYQMEEKEFFKVSNIDYQMADMGYLPRTYTSLKKAKSDLKRLLQLKKQIYNEDWVLDEKKNFANEWNTIERWHHFEDGGIRRYITIYKFETIK